MVLETQGPESISKKFLEQSDHHFRRGQIGRLESDQIAKYIEKEGYNWARENPNALPAQARGKLINLVHVIEQKYTRDRHAEKERNEAHGKVVANPPSRFLVRGARTAALLITFTELVIIAISIVFSGQTIVALVIGAILALASYFSGLGLGTIMFSAFRRPDRDLNTESGNVVLSGWVRFLVSLGVAAVMAGLRSNNGRDVGALVFTVGFTALIVTFTAIGEFLRSRYEEDLESYYQGEAELAADWHRMAAAGAKKPDADPLAPQTDSSIDYRWIAAFELGVRQYRSRELVTRDSAA